MPKNFPLSMETWAGSSHWQNAEFGNLEEISRMLSGLINGLEKRES
jgi:hypothetical protein